MLAIVTVCTISIGIYTFTQKDETVQKHNNYSQFMQIETGKRGDDPLYAEEIKKNTALTLQARDKAEMLARQLAEMKKEKEKSDVKTEQALQQINELMQRLQVLNEEKNNSQNNTLLQNEVDQKIQTMTDNINALSQNIKILSEENNKKIQSIESTIKTHNTQTTDTTINKTKNTELLKGSKITRVYGNNDTPVKTHSLLQNMTDGLNHAGRFISQGIDNKEQYDYDNQQSNKVPRFRNPQKEIEWDTSFPVYTLAPNTVLANSTLITPIIGRVPLGRNDISDPFFFKVEIGKDNLSANGHHIPGIAKMIASGYATGIKEQSCVRGYIDTLTFIFVDGRIVTQGERSTNGSGNDQAIGYLADKWGKPCIRGKYINNAKDYLMSRGLASFVEAAAHGLSQSQMTAKANNDGSRQAILNGNVWSYILGAGIGGSASEIAEYVRERASNAFDVVYVEQNKPVQIWIDKMIPIDYDSQARKTQYYDTHTSTKNYD